MQQGWKRTALLNGIACHGGALLIADAKVFEMVRTAAVSDVRIDDRPETGDAVYAVRDIEAGRRTVQVTAERTT